MFCSFESVPTFNLPSQEAMCTGIKFSCFYVQSQVAGSGLSRGSTQFDHCTNVVKEKSENVCWRLQNIRTDRPYFFRDEEGCRAGGGGRGVPRASRLDRSASGITFRYTRVTDEVITLSLFRRSDSEIQFFGQASNNDHRDDRIDTTISGICCVVLGK